MCVLPHVAVSPQARRWATARPPRPRGGPRRLDDAAEPYRRGGISAASCRATPRARAVRSRVVPRLRTPSCACRGGSVPEDLPYPARVASMRRTLLLVAVAVLTCSGTASATTHLVTNPNDSGAGSLRDAILLANADAAATPADPDTILLSPDITTDIGPTTPWPTLANHITLIGPESLTVQIKGAKTFRALTVAAGVTVHLINARVTSGSSTDVGAGILNAGDLT